MVCVMSIDPLVASTTAAATFAAVLVVALVAGFVHIRRLNRDLRRTRDRHRRSLRRDPLTGVATRAALRDRLDAVDGDEGYTVVVVDLDGFSAVNERHGETVGDALLAEVARRICRHTKETDVVGRLDGDAFAVVRPGRVPDEAAARWTATLLAAVRTPVVLTDGTTLPVAATAGRATAAPGMRPLAVVRAAEQNMLLERRSRAIVDRGIDARLGPRSAGVADAPSATRTHGRRITVPAQRTAHTAETSLVVRH